MAVNIGVIAEELNDIEVLYEFTCKLIPESSFSFSKFIGHGCGKLRRKCNAWTKNLIQRGCSHIVIIHDLDENDESTLRKELENNIIERISTYSLILIPIFEIEAWLLTDPLALKQSFNMKKTPKIKHHPETIRNPKEYLRNIVFKYSQKQYINTIHNRQIASNIRIDRVSSCSSFISYPGFVTNYISPIY